MLKLFLGKVGMISSVDLKEPTSLPNEYRPLTLCISKVHCRYCTYRDPVEMKTRAGVQAETMAAWRLHLGLE